MKRLVFILVLVIYTNGFSQAETDTIEQVKIDSLQLERIEDAEELYINTDTIFLVKSDSLTFKIHREATLIDSLWLKELTSSPLYDTIQYVLREDELVFTELEELPTELLKERLEHLNSRTPFNIEYNTSLEQVIRIYLKRRKSSFSGLLEKARYYFPMFEEQLANYDLPLEMKYLAIVESALKPRAKSRVGATGLWQFMYQTGKQFDLNVSSYVDERSSPYEATEAACKYLSSLYEIFGDWDLALAAYNSGPGNVSKAIRRSGGKTNYWNIRHNLPRETAGYVPAFYATLYIFEYAKEHNIVAKESALALFQTDTVQVKRQLTFEQINETLNVDIELLQFLNPQYKLDIIPYIEGRNYTLTLPKNDIGNFLSNEKNIYAYVDAEEAKREKPLPRYVEMNDAMVYRVRSGDYLGKIANNYGVSVASLKRWNNLRSTRLRIGQRLTVYPRNFNDSKASETKKTTKKEKPKGKYEIYTVRSGDSLWIIAQKYGTVSVQDLKDWNDISNGSNIKPGTKLKIY
jgi:membrane-bound lytic murein transglycosylase D